MGETIAIIPARGGSRRISSKNIRPFCGRPIIAYPIEMALGCKLFDRVVVSTDSPEIAEIARGLGAETPFERPARIADDHTTTSVVLAHALHALGGQEAVGRVCCIYPTTPFMLAADLSTGLDLISEHNVASVFAVTSFPSPIFRALKLTDDGHLKMIWPEYLDTRSDDLPEALHDAGMFYWVRAAKFLDDPVLYGPDSLPVRIPRARVHDIDTPEDWERAELVYRALNAGAPGAAV